MVAERTARDLQQPRAVARRGGSQRDPVGRKIEVE